MALTETLRAPTIVPFAEDHLDGAARLLAQRHRAQRVVEPGLDPRYEDAAAARQEIEEILGGDGASGTAAVSGDELVGFLIGRPRDASWGPNVWVDPAGHAVAQAELVRDLYAVAAERWVTDGLTSHYAMVPATDPALVDAWFRLGFGHQHVYAIRHPPDHGRPRPPRDAPPRRARDDIDVARAARRRAARAPGALARLLAAPAADRRGGARRVDEATSTTRGTRRSSPSGTGW
jgi:hypothetical protein